MEGRSLSEKLREKRAQAVIAELEAVALRLFDARGFDNVTVEEIAAEAGISVRTFYRYFSTKDEVLQVRIDRRTEALQVALQERPIDEPPLRSVHLALVQVVSAEDPAPLQSWIRVIAATPSLLRSVLGGNILKTDKVIKHFLASRMGLPPDALAPMMLAAAVEAVVQAAQRRWFTKGGDLTATIIESLDAIEEYMAFDRIATSKRTRQRTRQAHDE